MAATAQDSAAPLRAYDKRQDDFYEEEYSPFMGIEKGSVLQEARYFNQQQVDARTCLQVITKLLYLLTQGETLTKKEASDVFFSVTKLFQNKDSQLRRMTYLCIKEIRPGPDEVIIVISSVMKDMNSDVELYKSNSIRVLSQIIDPALLQQIERYLKQAIVDKSPVVASAALVAGLQLQHSSPDIIKRWQNEAQEAAQSKNVMVQFHAIALLHTIRSSDRLAVTKMIQTLIRANLRSPLAQVLLIRYVSKVIRETPPSSQGGQTRPFYEFLEQCMRHKHEQVVIEAARAIAGLKDVTSRELQPAIGVLQLFLTAGKPVLRFAAVRTLNQIAQTQPMAVANCNIDLETLISDSNRSIATLAITTLLKTGNERSIDRLLKQISSFVADISDDFKIVVVQSIQSLCHKYPQKHRSLMNFLSSILREEGGFEFKRTIVDCILQLIEDIPDAKEPGLYHLCEFIEDCEFSYLSQQILQVLGQEGPSTSSPHKYIRYVYNRTILEASTVRAAAVSSLAAFAAQVDELRERVLVLLQRCLHDNDDEVRDRATLFVKQLEGSASDMGNISQALPVPLVNLECALQSYLAGDTSAPFDLSTVSTQAPEPPSVPSRRTTAMNAAVRVSTPEPEVQSRRQLQSTIGNIPQLASLGEPFMSSSQTKLTEEGTEYDISVIKHIYDQHLLLQFQCTNTVAEQVLQDVTVAMDLSDAEGFSESTVIPLGSMPLQTTGDLFVLLDKQKGIQVGRLGAVLRFTAKEVDPTNGEVEEEGYEDEYQLEDVIVVASDYIKPAGVGNFIKEWETLGEENQHEDQYSLGPREGIQETVEMVIGVLGMVACDGTDAVPPNARSHTILLAGEFLGNIQALVRVSFGIDAGSNVAMKVAARSQDGEVSEFIHEILQEG